MPAEIEAKIKVPNHEAVREALRRAGGTLHARRLEINIFFDTPAAALRNADKGLRLRHNHYLADPGGQDEMVITFKGPQQPGLYKKREEIELTVTDAAAAEALLAGLGFHRTLSFEKRRESWRLQGCLVELDELPHLGTFVEVEGPSESAVQNVLHTLGMENPPCIKTSYIAMLGQWLETQGGGIRDVKF